MSFEDKLKQAIERGKQRRSDEISEHERQKMTEAEIRRRHNDLKLRLSDHIEKSIVQLIEHFPGFQSEVLYGERGWGAAISRDDLLGRGQKSFSRLELYVRPLSSEHLVDILAKGTVRNRELFSRNYHEAIESADVDKLESLVDTWILEYAELYASR